MPVIFSKKGWDPEYPKSKSVHKFVWPRCREIRLDKKSVRLMDLHTFCTFHELSFYLFFKLKIEKKKNVFAVALKTSWSVLINRASRLSKGVRKIKSYVTIVVYCKSLMMNGIEWKVGNSNIRYARTIKSNARLNHGLII